MNLLKKYIWRPIYGIKCRLKSWYKNRMLPGLGKRFEAPLTSYAARWTKYVRLSESEKSEKIFMKHGVLPVVDHYYHPLIDPAKHLTKSLREDRSLPGIDFNIDEQLNLLQQFHYNDELLKYPVEKTGEHTFHYENGFYSSGDAEYLYNIVRHFKPEKVIEIGCGSSTLMIIEAVSRNKAEVPGYECDHICVEPYEQPWLEQTGVTVLREKVEDVPLDFFKQLGKDDILFIDSSHIIRPQGDVLFEYLELLPVLKSGVIIHVHDIFSPKDYPDDWIIKRHLLWNEQYLLEAFLNFNNEFKIIGSLNLLAHRHREALAAKCPVFAMQEGKEPGAFWMTRK